MDGNGKYHRYNSGELTDKTTKLLFVRYLTSVPRLQKLIWAFYALSNKRKWTHFWATV